MLINLDKINGWSHWEYPLISCGGVFYFEEDKKISNLIEISQLLVNTCQKWEICQFVPNALINPLKIDIQTEICNHLLKKEGYEKSTFFKNFVRFRSTRFVFFDTLGNLSNTTCTHLENTRFKNFCDDNLVYFDNKLHPYPDMDLISVDYCYFDLNETKDSVLYLTNKGEIVNNSCFEIPLYLGVNQILDKNEVQKFKDLEINWSFYLNINTDIFLQKIDRVSIYTKDYTDRCTVDNSILARENAPRLNSFLRDLEKITKQYNGLWYYDNEPSQLINDGLIDVNRRIVIDGVISYAD